MKFDVVVFLRVLLVPPLVLLVIAEVEKA